MGGCVSDLIVNKVTNNKLTTKIELNLVVLRDIENCRRIKTRSPIEIVGDTATFDEFTSPDDVFNCLAVGCTNSGTLNLSGAAGGVVSAKFAAHYDATEFQAGIATYYIYFPAAGTYKVTTTMSDALIVNQADADVFEQSISVTAEGFAPVVVDFSEIPTSVSGSGWVASPAGAIINIAILASNASQVANYGVSSIFFYESIEDLMVSDLVKIGCIDDITSALTAEVLEAICSASGLNPDSAAVELSFTGRRVTPNYWKLNPAMQEGDKTTGWKTDNVQRTVEERIINGVKYGAVKILDANMEECAFFMAQVADACDIQSAQLSRVNIPTVIKLNAKQYQVLDGTTTVMSDAGTFLFNESLIGKQVIISYPKTITGKQRVATADAIGKTRVRGSYTIKEENGASITRTFNNLFVTSFPMALTKEETTFPFTLSVGKQPSGEWYDEFVEED